MADIEHDDDFKEITRLRDRQDALEDGLVLLLEACAFLAGHYIGTTREDKFPPFVERALDRGEALLKNRVWIGQPGDNHGTSGGVELTDEVVEELSDEAEQGYDLDRLVSREEVEE